MIHRIDRATPVWLLAKEARRPERDTPPRPALTARRPAWRKPIAAASFDRHVAALLFLGDILVDPTLDLIER